MSEYVPGAHAVGAETPSAHENPEGQRRQAAPTGYCPAAQALAQALALAALYESAGQERQAAPSVLKKPASQGTHEPARELGSLPGEHAEQAVAPAVLNVNGAQAEHVPDVCAASALLKVPAGQRMHARPVWYVPAGQNVTHTEDPGTLTFPNAHGEHETAPGNCEKAPAGHTMHDDEDVPPVDEKVPGGQDVHVAEFRSEKVPALH